MLLIHVSHPNSQFGILQSQQKMLKVKVKVKVKVVMNDPIEEPANNESIR